MPQERKKEHKSSHHVATTDIPVSWWQNFHFSGKVIMCSVLFGMGLALIGGLLLAIGAYRRDDENKGNLDEIQNKAPMFIVGTVIMGIGGFTVFTGIIMCLFETNICRKRQGDSKPLIEEHNSETAARNTDATSMPSTTQKREKNCHRKKPSSPRKHKTGKKQKQSSSPSSPSSIPIDIHQSLSREFSASDTFLTPPNSLAYEHKELQPTRFEAETSASLMKSFTSSGKSWNTSADFQTPSSSFHESSGVFQNREDTLGISPEQEELSNAALKNLKHEFVSPKNSSAEVIEVNSSSSQETAPINAHEEHNHDKVIANEFDKEMAEKLNAVYDSFVTPMNSYVDQPNVSAPKWDSSNDNES